MLVSQNVSVSVRLHIYLKVWVFAWKVSFYADGKSLCAWPLYFFSGKHLPMNPFGLIFDKGHHALTALVHGRGSAKICGHYILFVFGPCKSWSTHSEQPQSCGCPFQAADKSGPGHTFSSPEAAHLLAMRRDVQPQVLPAWGGGVSHGNRWWNPLNPSLQSLESAQELVAAGTWAGSWPERGPILRPASPQRAQSQALPSMKRLHN